MYECMIEIIKENCDTIHHDLVSTQLLRYHFIYKQGSISV